MDTEQRRIRVRLIVAAYAYEFLDHSIMSDHEFDQLSLKVVKGADTGSPNLDKFFNEVFEPHTGVWIHQFPDLSAAKAAAIRLIEGRKKKEQTK